MRDLTFRVASNAKAPGLTRAHLASMKSFLEPRFEDVQLLVSELVTNSVRHSKSDDIHVKVEVVDKSLIRVEVADDGPGFSGVTDQGDGLGLKIVEKISDRWGFASSGPFVVWAELSKSRA